MNHCKEALKKKYETGIQAVIFDVDGVLLDSLGFWNQFGARYLQSKGYVPENGLNAILFSVSMEEGAVYLKEHYSLNLIVDEILEDIRGLLRDFYNYEVKAKKNAVNLLKALKDSGIRMCAATSSPREHVERALERNGLLPYLDRIYTSSEIGSSKHSPEIYHAASAFMGADPAYTMVVEDSLYALCTAAKAGYHTMGVYDPNGEPAQEELKEAAEWYVRDFEELLLYGEEDSSVTRVTQNSLV